MIKTIKTRHRVVHGSSTQLNEISNNSIQLIVTSPPYGDVKEYDRENECNIGNYKDEEYIALMTDVYKECKRILEPGRRLCINISDVPVMTEWGQAVSMLGQKTVEIIENMGGFVLNNIIIWTKGRCRAGSDAVGTLPYPGSPVLLNNWEYVYIFKKEGAPHYPQDPNIREASKVVKEELRDWLYCTWAIMTERDRRHIAPYPVELPYRLIRLFSYVGETVYDPFLGSGTTMQAARMCGRSSVGYDVGYDLTPEAVKSLGSKSNPIWLDLIKNKVGWGQQVIDPIRDAVITMPIKYEYIEDEDSLASMSTLVRDEQLEASPLANISSAPVIEDEVAEIAPNDEIKDVCDEFSEPTTFQPTMPLTSMFSANKLITVTPDVPVENIPEQVIDRCMNSDIISPFIKIVGGKLVFKERNYLYPILELGW